MPLVYERFNILCEVTQTTDAEQQDRTRISQSIDLNSAIYVSMH